MTYKFDKAIELLTIDPVNFSKRHVLYHFKETDIPEDSEVKVILNNPVFSYLANNTIDNPKDLSDLAVQGELFKEVLLSLLNIEQRNSNLRISYSHRSFDLEFLLLSTGAKKSIYEHINQSAERTMFKISKLTPEKYESIRERVKGNTNL